MVTYPVPDILRSFEETGNLERYENQEPISLLRMTNQRYQEEELEWKI